MQRVYLDYAATTPVDPEVRDAMLPFLSGEAFGNPSSVHAWGQRVRNAIDAARDTAAAAIGAHSSEIYFTSGGTEADNTALLGVLLANRDRGGHVVTTTIEHHAVLNCARFAAEDLGFSVSYVTVDAEGRVDPDAVEAAMTEKTTLVSVMHANNEIGTIQPVAEIARRVHARGVLFHTDAVQTLGQMPLDVLGLGADLVTLSAHKIYGPKGIGALYVRKGTHFSPWLHGGQQEREKRAGTENAAGIVGFGKAMELLPRWWETEPVRAAALRDRLFDALHGSLPDIRRNGPVSGRLPNNLNVSFPGADGEALLLNLDARGVAASSGSACASGSIEPSHVLLALGLPLPLVRSAVRFSLGRQTTEAEIDTAAEQIIAAVREVRG